MNKGKLEKFAIDSRKELIDKIKIKAMQYGIEEDKIKNSQTVSSDSVVINGRPLSNEEKIQRERLIQKIRYINEKGEDGYKQIVEEVAYTWFNRFTALRFMEVNNYLPTRVRALSSETPGNVEPDLIKEANNVDLPVDKQKIYNMKLNNDIEGLFKYLIIAQCNSLNKSLPFMFEKIGHYTELLFPDGLLNDNSFIRKLTNTEIISEEDWQEVEIIGWLYQYYNSEEKNRVIKAKKKYKKEEIPFATQLFTPDWIVRYMVQNTLGRYWIESHPEHSDLKKNWEFYLESPNPEPDFQEKLVPYINKELKVEEIKCFDPAMGSGHVLVYMFDVLYEIYEKCGYMSREIPQLIIENNLYGLDIEDRAYQLACFAVIMKGMKYNNRLLRIIEREAERTAKEGIKINIASIQETNNLNDDDIIYLAGESSGKSYNKVESYIKTFKNGKINGSLIKVGTYDEEYFENRLDNLKTHPAQDLFQENSRNKIVEILPMLMKQSKIMTETYDVLVTNPPYMGNKYMNTELVTFMKKEYPNNNTDTFSAFIEYGMEKVKAIGHLGFLTPFVWMFIASYEGLRRDIVENKSISSLIQLEYNAFPEACVPVCTFTLRNYKIDMMGEYIKLSDFRGSEVQAIKVLEAVNNPLVNYRFSSLTKNFSNIPGWPIAFWVSEKFYEIFKNESKLDKYAEPKQGMATCDNKRFLRYWFEVDYNKCKFNSLTRLDAKESKKKWFPYHKGGSFRKWYGNHDYIVNWYNDGQEIKEFTAELNKEKPGGRVKNEEYYFRKGLTWSALSSGKISFRAFEDGFLFDTKGSVCFIKDDAKRMVMAGLLNSKVVDYQMQILAPTLDFNPLSLRKLAITIPMEYKEINKLVIDSVKIAKEDWDNFETSWDFKTHPFLQNELRLSTVKDVFRNWSEYTNKQFYKLKANEEQLNEIYIDLYNLNGEMTHTVEEKDITIKKADRERDVKSFISYALGCIFGRYSLDEEGLVYAGGKFDYSKYKTFKVDEDNIMPVLSENYFEDDMVSKFVEFVKVTFGEETLSKNLEYIAETLGKKSNETAKETIRRYFLTDFYKDHLQTYKNRPIYWMFTSGKQKAFNCLIYMHRYDKTTLSRIRTDYLHELQDRLDTERKSLVDVIEGDYSTKEKSEAKKKLTQLDKQIDEIKKYDEVLHHMADMQIEIDLDDGVKANYDKFKGLLAKI